jgi:hypothetical protein|nr:MAG TPA_asm: hypothetical protein [Caudoviricetes sp.]
MNETIFISDLIEALEEIKENHGDIEVYESLGDPIKDLANILNVKTDGDDEFLEIG